MMEISRIARDTHVKIEPSRPASRQAKEKMSTGQKLKLETSHVYGVTLAERPNAQVEMTKVIPSVRTVKERAWCQRRRSRGERSLLAPSFSR